MRENKLLPHFHLLFFVSSVSILTLSYSTFTIMYLYKVTHKKVTRELLSYRYPPYCKRARDVAKRPGDVCSATTEAERRPRTFEPRQGSKTRKRISIRISFSCSFESARRDSNIGSIHKSPKNPVKSRRKRTTHPGQKSLDAV